MKVWINGNPYELQNNTKVTRKPMVEFPDNLRLVGQQKRVDRSGISAWRIGAWNKGFGVLRGDADSADDMSSFWDSECDTRFPGQITRPANPIHCTVNPVPAAAFRWPFAISAQQYFTHHGGTIAWKYAPPDVIGSENMFGVLKWGENWSGNLAPAPLTPQFAVAGSYPFSAVACLWASQVGTTYLLGGTLVGCLMGSISIPSMNPALSVVGTAVGSAPGRVTATFSQGLATLTGDFIFQGHLWADLRDETGLTWNGTLTGTGLSLVPQGTQTLIWTGTPTIGSDGANIGGTYQAMGSLSGRINFLAATRLRGTLQQWNAGSLLATTFFGTLIGTTDTAKTGGFTFNSIPTFLIPVLSYSGSMSGTQNAAVDGLFIEGNAAFFAKALPSSSHLSKIGSLNAIELLQSVINIPLATASEQRYTVEGNRVFGLAENRDGHLTMFNAKKSDIDTGAVTPTITGTISSLATLGNLNSLVKKDNSVFAVMPEGIFNVGCYPIALVEDMGAFRDNNVRGIQHKGQLYFTAAGGLYGIDFSRDTLTPVGPDLRQGLPADKTGNITALASSWKFMYAAVQGPTHSFVMAYDGAWHHMAKIGSVGAEVKEMFLSSDPDDIMRLWLMYASGNPNYLLNPVSNPLTAPTYSFAPTGHFCPPASDLGMAEVDGAIYALSVNVDAQGTPNNLEVCYGLEMATPTTSLGNIATLSHLFRLGANNYGVSARRFQPRFILSGNNSGTTSVLREATVQYVKLPPVRETFTFTIDLEKTADIQARPLETLITELQAVGSSVTLVPFWYGRIPTKTVRVIDIPIDEVEQDEDDPDVPVPRTGLIKVTLADGI